MVESERDLYGSGVASLIGDAVISLDGQSIQLPDESGFEVQDDKSGLDLQDDISSINESSYYRGVGGPPQIEIVGASGDMTGGDIECLTPVSAAGNNGDRKSPDQTTSTDFATSVNSSHKPPLNMKNTSKLSVEGSDKRGKCVPKWVAGAPNWLKFVIVFSTAMLLGAVALVSVALSTALTQQNEINSQAANGGATSPSSYVPVSSTPAPSAFTTVSDGTNPQANSSPTKAPTQSTPDQESNNGAPLPTPETTGSVSDPVEAESTPSSTTSSEASTQPATNATSEETAGSEATEPYDSFVTTFFVTGGRFTNDALTLVPDQLKTLPVRGGTSFLVHLGDWNSPYATRCDRQSYQDVNDLFSNSSIPVYFVPGDNDFNDCPDPNQAMSLWHEYLGGYETQHWDEPSQWTIERGADDNYPENFAFVYNEILFVGINLVGGVLHDQKEWATRQEANLKWIDDNYNQQKDFIKAFVLFAHADPDVPSNAPFYEPFKQRVAEEYNNVPVVLIHRNLGVEPWSWETEFEDIANFSVVVVAGSVWPPMMGAIDFRQENPFIFEQDTWYDDYIEHQVTSG